VTVFLLQYNAAVEAGLYWQLFTSLFVAVPSIPGVVDVVFNALAVVWLDGMLEGAYSEREYYATFILTGLVGNLFSLLNGPAQSSFGASGGIFGLLAGAVSEDFASRRRVNPVFLLWFLLVFVMSSFALSYVDWLAHLGGALAGLLVGYYLGARRSESDL
jgi:rhomboid protease GluP